MSFLPGCAEEMARVHARYGTFATLFRISLNVAATRLILTDADAGQVIGAVGTFVVSGNYVIGLIVFLILVVVQYVVVTSGAQRVSEVAARFTLDSMPGQQMSIDADLNMGFIDQVEAQRRRKNLEKEAAFYGAMDGASKFVKGDAIAGIIILLINIIGGLVIGVMQLGMSWAQALQTFTLLTIGDGIVPPWLRRLDPHWAAVLVGAAGCGRGGPCSFGETFPAAAFESLWSELAPLAFPIPEWQCKERPTSVRRLGSEKASFVLLRCDGSIADGALAELSILARPTSAARVESLPDEPDPRAPAGEWVPGVRLVDPRLLWLLAHISDHFRWKPIYLYSGYRPARAKEPPRDPEAAPAHSSLHASGRALDIAIDGVDNEELLKLCFDLPDTGCGYYPHNRFVHIDVRPRSSGSSVWVDASAPGEPSAYIESWTGVVANGRVVWIKPR